MNIIQARQHRDALIGKLVAEHATDVGNQTMQRVFATTVAPAFCIAAATTLRDAGELTTADLVAEYES